MSLLTGMLQLLPPETAHNVTIQLTKYGSPLLSKGFQDQSLHNNIKGLILIILGVITVTKKCLLLLCCLLEGDMTNENYQIDSI